MAGMPWDDYAAAPQAAAEPATVEDAAPWADYAAEPSQPVQPPPADKPWNANDSMPESWQPALRGLDDYGLSLSKGVLGVGEFGLGIGDILSGGRVTPWVKEKTGFDPAERRAALDAQATPEHQQAMRELDQAKGMADTLQALRDNPSLVPHAIVESAPSMLAGGVAGRGIALGMKGLGVAPGMAGMIGTGAGEGTVAAGQQASQTVQENQQKGVDGLSLGQTAAALGTGLGTGLLGMAGARIARRFGVADIDAQLAGANGADVAKGFVNRALIGTGIESLEELTQSGQQQVLSNLANDRPAMEGVTKQMVVGGVVGGAMGGVAGLRRPTLNDQAEQPPAVPAAVPEAEAMATPAPAAPPTPPAPQPAPPPVPKTPFAGSQDITPLLDNLGVQGEQRTQSLSLLRPAEQDIEARRRGVVTMAEQRRLASLIGLEATQAQVFTRKIGQAWNAEQTIAATDMVADRLKSVMEQQQRIASGQATDLEKASFVQDLGDMKTMFGELMGARAESGRALAAQRRQVQNMREAQQILEGIGGVQGADDLAAAIGKAVQSGGVKNLARVVAKPESRMQRLFGYYYRAALLSGVRTHAVNIMSNAAVLGNESIERGIAGGIGSLKRKFTNGRYGETEPSEALSMVVGTARGMSKAGAAAVDAFKTGESAVLGGQPARHDNSVGLNNTPRQPGVLGGAAFAADRAAGLTYRTLGAEDAFFATLNYEAELRAMARRQAMSEFRSKQLPEGVKVSQRTDELVQNPTAQMIEVAGERARTNTFNSKAGAFANSIMMAKSKAPWLNLIAPFVRTPENIVKYGLKRTPLAPLFKDVREDIMAGGARQEQAIARIVWGAGVMITAGAAAQAGYITGAGPDDKKEKQALLATGWRPYSIKVGDTYHEYNRADPFSMWLGLAADMSTMDYQHKDAGDISAAVLGSLVNNTVNKTYMQGLSNFIEFMQDPKRNAEWYSRQMVGTMAQPFTLLSNIASENDPFAREGNSIFDAIKYRIPGLRQDLPTKLDGYGEPVPNRTYPGGPFSIGAPIAQSQESTDPVRTEAGRLGWSPTEFQKSMTLNGKKIEIPTEQHHELALLAGRMTHRGAQRLMQSKAWQSMDDEARKDALDALGKKARAAVRMAAIPYITSGKRAALDKLRGQVEAQR